MMEPLAADRTVVRYDPGLFDDWYADLLEKAEMRIDKMAARYLWERGYGIMDALIKITST